jgi:hypothetical protein
MSGSKNLRDEVQGTLASSAVFTESYPKEMNNSVFVKRHTMFYFWVLFDRAFDFKFKRILL